MPAVFLTTLAKALFDALRNPSSAGSSSEDVALGFIRMQQVIIEVVRGLTWVLAQVWGAKKYEYPLAQRIAKDMQQAQKDTQNAVSHVGFTILPNSLNYLKGYVYSDGIIPLRHQTAQLLAYIKTLFAWRVQIDGWRTRTVDPALAQWDHFYKWFITWPQSILNLWHDWLTNPTHFAQWADPPIAATMPGYLAGSGAKGDRDNLNAVLLSAWGEDTQVVQQLINRWLLSPG